MPKSSKTPDKFLALVSDESLWDKSKEIFFLGDEVCAYKSCHNDPEKVLLPRYWADERRLRSALKFTEKSYENVLKIISAYLNEIHGLEKNIMFWRRILGFFLRSYVDTMYDKYARLVDASENMDDFEVITLSPCSYEVSDNALNFVQALRASDLFNLQLFSQIITELNYCPARKVRRQFSLVECGNVIQRAKSEGFKSRVINYLHDAMNRGPRAKVALYLSMFSNKSLMLLILKTRLSCWPMFTESERLEYVDKDKQVRAGLSRLHGSSQFEDLILKTLSDNIPTDYIEGFSRYYKRASDEANENVPCAIVTGVGFMYSSDFSFWAAECADRGAKIYGMQHGGTYGEVDYITTGESFESSVVDSFITWGWQRDKRTIPLPPSRFAGLKKVKSKKNDRILWVTTTDSKHVSFMGNIVFASRFVEYFDHQHILYQQLSARTKGKLSVRLYPNDFGWALKDRWYDRSSSIHLADVNEPLVLQAQRHALIVVDHFGGTSTLECLSLNIPTIIVGNKKLFKLDEDAREYYKLLEDVGVLFYDKRQAAKAIERISVDVDEWWSVPNRQAAIVKFLCQFALPSEDPLNIWVRFLKKLKGRDRVGSC